MGMITGGGAGTAKIFAAALNAAAKPCSYCKTASALLFCRTDSAFMCIACDSKVHHDDDTTRPHERVWVCEVCEQAPAVVTCKADAAALCVSCDRDIHSANPLSSRHERVPVVPFYDSAESVVMESAADAAVIPVDDCGDPGVFGAEQEVKLEQGNNGYISDPWISMNPMKSMEILFHDSGPDNFLDLENYQTYSDSIVPVQTAAARLPVPAQFPQVYPPAIGFEVDFTKSNISAYNSYTSHSVSSSSMDFGVVPDGCSTMSEISYPFARSINPSASQVVGTDREARVLRYREKRKNRKFEKTIRYASRKAYAESRPRIKGRFAKRTAADDDIDGMFDLGMTGYSATAAADSGYGLVPSFLTRECELN